MGDDVHLNPIKSLPFFMTVLERCKFLGIETDSLIRGRFGEKISTQFKLLNPGAEVERVDEIQTVSVRKYPESFHAVMDEIILKREPIERKKRARITAIKVNKNG